MAKPLRYCIAKANIPLRRFVADHILTSIEEKLFNGYLMKKTSKISFVSLKENTNDSLTDVAKLLDIVEAQIVRILYLSAKSDTDFRGWGF